jgi:hypothetical protein
MDLEALRAELAAAGYELRYREDGWVECLMLGDGESYVGQGRCRDTALMAAVERACPSTLARRALSELVGKRPQPVVALRSEEPELKPVTRLKEPSGPPPLVLREVPARPDLARAMDDLLLLDERIRDSKEELGLSSPERQRLAILSWICEARAHTDLFPNEARIREQVACISRKLTEVGKGYWPGSVTALQLQMSPRDLPRPLLGGNASTWGRAAELSERALSTLEHGDERRGFDPYGWADATKIDPVPADANALLDGLVAQLEAKGGGLDRSAEAKDADSRPEPEEFLRWVRLLRWLRVTPIDADRWGKAAGRLRWWASRKDPRLLQAVRELEPAYSPPVPWAEYFAEIPTAACCQVGLPASLLAEVQPKIAQRRVLLATFRRDPELLGRLQGALTGATLEWRVIEPARISDLTRTITERGTDVVLGALGLQSQAVDQALARACRSAGVPYVRVNWGRPLVCVRGLALKLAGRVHPLRCGTEEDPTRLAVAQRDAP